MPICKICEEIIEFDDPEIRIIENYFHLGCWFTELDNLIKVGTKEEE